MAVPVTEGWSLERQSKVRPRRLPINWVAYGIVLPAVLIRASFTLIPTAQTFYLSFTNKSLMNHGRFIGLRNYEDFFHDSTLIGSLGFTVFYTVASVLLETCIGLVAAMMLMRVVRGKVIANLLMLLPWAVAPLLAATVWKIMYYEQGGILNDILARLGLIHDPVRWLSDGTTARVSVIITTTWKNVSWVTLIFMAGLGSLPQDVYEAAAMDGAGPVQRLRHITLPLLKPTIYLVLMFRGMGEVQTFEQINGLTRGGPGTATTTLAVYAYQRFFQELRYGYGSAVNVLLLALTLLIGAFFAWRLYAVSR